jgi:hypothetical protein
MWGGVLALALFGAAIGVAQWVERGGGDAREPDGLRLGEDGLPLGDRLDERTGAELPEGFVPDLPAVPTLPPGAHRDVMATEASTDDERLDALAVEMRLVREARGLIESDPAAAPRFRPARPCRRRSPVRHRGDDRRALHGLPR